MVPKVSEMVPNLPSNTPRDYIVMISDVLSVIAASTRGMHSNRSGNIQCLCCDNNLLANLFNVKETDWQR